LKTPARRPGARATPRPTPRPAPLAAMLLLALAGCTVGPDHATPSTAAPDAFGSLDNAATLAAGAPVTPTADPLAPGALAAWWTLFGDPSLDALVARAVRSNLDLRVAAARVREARALRGQARADSFPTVDATGGVTRRRDSDNTRFGPGSFSGGDGGGAGADDSYSLFQAGLDASWEIDVFGAVRRGVEAADAELASTIEDRRAILVTVVSEVARNYVELRGFQQRILLSERTIAAQQGTVDLTTSRFEAGLSADLEVAQSQGELATRQSELPTLRIGLQQAAHRLGVLLGQDPGALARELETSGSIPRSPAAVPVGLPSDLLRRRPDIRRAERDIAAASARIGVATADLFPRFSLTGAFGFQSEEIGNLFEGNSRAWSVGPAVRWNIFDAGRIRNRIQAADAREEQALASYELTVLTSFEEVENALTGFVQEQARRRALQAAVDANRRAVDLSSDRYRGGVGDFLNVLQSQRGLYDVEDRLVQSEAAVTRSLIALYKALGGGWDDARTDPNAEADASTDRATPIVDTPTADPAPTT